MSYYETDQSIKLAGEWMEEMSAQELIDSLPFELECKIWDALYLKAHENLEEKAEEDRKEYQSELRQQQKEDSGHYDWP